ncbi:hypothetical protein [Nostoc sp.]|uniref:hypothetical protein n=1 Tax=Nostoc sp. TaxID=1180 RepID=UPI002FEF157E
MECRVPSDGITISLLKQAIALQSRQETPDKRSPTSLNIETLRSKEMIQRPKIQASSE